MALRDSQIPAIKIEQIQEVESLIVEVHGIQVSQMMDKAGRNLAELLRSLMRGQ